MIQAASLFSQLLTQFPRNLFGQIVQASKAERHAKGFTCWDQFVAMMFCQLAQADSLRDICNGLRCCIGKLVHLGVKQAPNKSTLAYANEHRTAELYKELFYDAFERFKSQGLLGGRKTKFRFKNKLLSLDSSTISLCLSLFPWAKFRRAKGGVKVHVLLDHDHYMPAFVAIGNAKVHDVKIARTLLLNPGSIVAMDRAYNDYRMFSNWTDRGVYFVTRMKDNAIYEVIQSQRIPMNRNILSDEIILLTGTNSKEKCTHPLRRIVVWDKENEREIVLLTNHMDFGSTTIADIYKERWEIEVFFKTLKQTMKIKSFVGTSENALQIQIWTALISMLLLKWLHHLSEAQWSFSNLVSMLRLNLFTYRDLMDWLHHPFTNEPIVPTAEQLLLPFGAFGQATK
jgi:hypothetical protein